MTKKEPGMIGKVFAAASLFSVLNMAALVGLCVYGFATGAVDGKKLRDIGRVLRGESAFAAKSATAAPVDQPKAAEATKPATGQESDEQLEMAHREAERIRTELEQRLALSNSILLKVREEREAFRKEREEAAARSAAVADVQKQDGFQRQVTLLESLSPKVAIEHLLAMSDVDDAARALSSMSTAKAKKIVESAKRGAESEQMKTILRRMREVAPTAVADRGGEEP